MFSHIRYLFGNSSRKRCHQGCVTVEIAVSPDLEQRSVAGGQYHFQENHSIRSAGGNVGLGCGFFHVFAERPERLPGALGMFQSIKVMPTFTECWRWLLYNDTDRDGAVIQLPCAQPPTEGRGASSPLAHGDSTF